MNTFISSNYRNVNLGNQDEFDKWLTRLGGSAMMAKYPAVHQELLATRERHLHGEFDPSLLPNMAEGIKVNDLQDAVYFSSINYHDKKLSVTVVVSLTKIAHDFKAKITVHDSKELFKGQKNISFSEKKYHVETWEEAIDLGDQFKISINGISFSTQKSTLVLFEDITYKCAAADPFSGRASINSPKKQTDTPLIELSDPIQTGKKIRVFYGRYPGSTGEKDVDYVFDKAYDPRKAIVKMTLPLQGKIDLDPKYRLGSYPVQECFSIIDFRNGAAGYMNPDGRHINQNEKSLSWTFDEDWQITLPSKNFGAKTLVDCILQLRLDISGLGLDDSSQYNATYYASSLLDKDIGFNCRRVRQLYVEIGCVLKGSRLLMADGSSKKIEDIRIGDRLAPAPGNSRPAIINNTWIGREQELICVETISGDILNLTGTHLILTSEGMIPANRLNAGMSIGLGDGSFSHIRFLYSREEDFEVYNLTLDATPGDLKRMICENIVISDNDNEEDPIPAAAQILEADNPFFKQFKALLAELDNGR